MEVLSLLFALSLVVAAAAQEPPARILFLHFKFKDDQISLIKTTVATGTLKTIPHGGHFKLEVELASAAGQILWTNVVPDPSIELLEYEDPDHPGEMTSKVVSKNDVEFVVRVPFMPQARQLKFYRAQPHSHEPTDPQAGKKKPDEAESPTRKSLGAVILPEETK